MTNFNMKLRTELFMDGSEHVVESKRSDVYTDDGPGNRDVLLQRHAKALVALTEWVMSVEGGSKKAEGWDDCLDAIEQNELNTEQARQGNPYRVQEQGEPK